MGRTRLRGFEWAGLKVAIEVPPGVVWEAPEGLADSSCHPDDADVHVSVELMTESSGLAEVTPDCQYSHEDGVFHAGRVGDDHWIRVEGDGRIARFDRSLRWVRVGMTPAAAKAGLFPLRRPLDDLVLIHRALANGAIAVRATAAVTDGSALVILGGGVSELPTARTSLWQGWLLLQPGADQVSVHPLPSTIRSGRFDTGTRVARLDGLHVIDSITGEEYGASTLDPDLAAGEVLRYAFAPLASAESTDHLVGAATELAARVPIVRLCSAGSSDFAWRSARTARSLVPPAGA
jgi:hypothetical protein